MKIVLEFPYDEYSGYVVTNPEGRKNICLVHKKTKKRTTISYARYLVSVAQKRVLDKNEHVDHIDGDKSKDVIENLQILTVKQNNQKRVKEKGLSRKMVKMKCPNCFNEFVREVRNSFISKKGYYSCCSRNCANKVSSKNLNIEQIKALGKNQIIEIFRA